MRRAPDDGAVEPTGPFGGSLTEVLEAGRSRGLLGPEPVARQIAHAEALAAIIEQVAGVPSTFVDIGSGGGLPGLVLAVRWPSSRALLLDARTRSAEFLEEAGSRLDLSPRVRVAHGRAEDIGRDTFREGFELAVCRSVGPPPVSAELAGPFVRLGGWVVVSEPPGGTSWDGAALGELGLDAGESVAAGGATARVLRKTSATDPRFPRRAGMAAKRPLWTPS